MSNHPNQHFEIPRSRRWAPRTVLRHHPHFLCLESDWPSSQTFHSSEWRHRGPIWSSPKMSMTLKVVTEFATWRMDEDDTYENTKEACVRHVQVKADLERPAPLDIDAVLKLLKKKKRMKTMCAVSVRRCMREMSYLET